MKKILFIFAVMFTALAIQTESKAQSVSQYIGPITLVTADTLANAATETHALGRSLLSNWGGVFVITRTNISGTTNVTVNLQGSLDNSEWVTVSTASGTGATTTTITVDNMYYRFYRLQFVGSGTQSTRYTAKYMLKIDR